MTEIATAYVRLRPNSANFQKEAESQIAGALSGIKKTVGAAIGGLGVYEVLKSTFEAAAKEQSAVASIRLAVKNAGAEWVVYGKTVKEILDEQEHAKGFDLPEEAQAFGRLEQQTKNTKLALADLNIAMDVSRGRHLALAQVATALSRLEGGNAQSLSRLGIITDKYTGAQDAVKSQIRDVTIALNAQSTARQKNYDGQLKITATQAALAAQSKSDLLARKAELTAQLAQAKASDKQTTTDQARAELLRRYSGQAEAFAKTAAGQFAILHTSIEQVQEAIGQAFLPLLSSGAKELGDWANSLAESDSFQRQLATGAHDVADGLHAIGDGIHAVEPLVGVLQQLVDVLGVGPAALALFGAWKSAPALLASAGLGTKALSADTVALKTSLAEVGTQLDALTGQIAAVGGAEAQATVATEGLTAAQAELVAQIDANIAATEALLATEEEATAASATFATGVSGLLGPLALLAGGLYYVHQNFDKSDDSAKRFSDTIGKVQDAAKLATTDVTGGKITRDQAKAALDAATAQHQAAQEAVASDSDASVSAQRLSTDQTALRDTTLSLRAATHAYALASADLHKKETDRASGTAQLKTQMQSLVTQVVALGTKSNQVAGFLASHGKDSWLKNLPQHSLDLFLKALDQLAEKNPSMKHAIENLKDVAAAAHKVPDKVTIALVLNPTLDAQELTDQIVGQIRHVQAAAQASLTGGLGLLGRGGLAPIPQKTGADFAADFLKAGGHFPAEVKVKVKPTGKVAATAYSQEFVQTIDASGIGQALVDAIGNARGQIESQASALASAVGDVLDARLARGEAKLDAAAKEVQDRIDARSAAAAARDSAVGASDAALKLKELQDTLGTGALTPEQQQALAAAKNAVLDAQDSVANASDQKQQDEITARRSALEEQASLEKTAASQRIADLGAELNRGLITQAKYVKGVRQLLDKEQVNYKTAGKLLGVAFADGFADSLSGVIAQAKALGLVGRTTLRGTPTSPTAVNPLAEQAKATQGVVDQIAGSGGRFKLTGTDNLPAGVSVASLLSAAGAQRAEASYRQKSSTQADRTIHYVGLTADHTAAILKELQKANARPPVVVVDDSKKKAKHAQATR